MTQTTSQTKASRYQFLSTLCCLLKNLVRHVAPPYVILFPFVYSMVHPQLIKFPNLYSAWTNQMEGMSGLIYHKTRNRYPLLKQLKSNLYKQILNVRLGRGMTNSRGLNYVYTVV